MRLPPPPPALRGPPLSDISVESGPVCAAPEPVPPLPPTLPPSCVGGGGGGRPAPLQLASDQVAFPTTAVGQRSAGSLAFTNGSGVGLRWTLEALVRPWIQVSQIPTRPSSVQRPEWTVVTWLDAALSVWKCS